MQRRSRGQKAEDEHLWQLVTQSIKPLHSHRPLFLPPGPVAKPAKALPYPLIEPFQIGHQANATRSHQLSPTLGEQLSGVPVQMDRKAYDRMQRGKLLPEARIDLHGMTLAQAHPALNRFIHETHAAGRRLVLVITGKGKRGDDTGPIPQRPGVLKHQVPQWLLMQPLASLVLQVAEAHLKHGGTGAYYVYLRRQR